MQSPSIGSTYAGPRALLEAGDLPTWCIPTDVAGPTAAAAAAEGGPEEPPAAAPAPAAPAAAVRVHTEAEYTQIAMGFVEGCDMAASACINRELNAVDADLRRRGWRVRAVGEQ